jgi:hypothetical protein
LILREKNKQQDYGSGEAGTTHWATWGCRGSSSLKQPEKGCGRII